MIIYIYIYICIHTWYEVRSKLDLVYYLFKESSRVSGTCTKHWLSKKQKGFSPTNIKHSTYTYIYTIIHTRFLNSVVYLMSSSSSLLLQIIVYLYIHDYFPRYYLIISSYYSYFGVAICGNCCYYWYFHCFFCICVPYYIISIIVTLGLL